MKALPLSDQPERAPLRPAGGGARRVLRHAVAAGAVMLLVGCASAPGEAFDSLLQRHGLESGTVEGVGFRHLYVRKGRLDKASELRVYLEGDGSPWIRGRRVARDPTSRNPVALRLMLRDPGDALYLARPCYHRVDESPPCHPRLWTSARYGEAVVESMTVALQRLLRDADARSPVTLVGYSGGGVLGMLLARRLDRVERVVTVAANLDTAAWVRLHGYSPLATSLNPAAGPPLRGDVKQLHLAGGEDSTVPPMLIEGALQAESNAALAVLDSFDHQCCWSAVWPTVLSALQGSRDICRQLERDLPETRCERVTGRTH
ncbi:MAG: alpha/beta hydrolase [Chromatiaceae bacterium]